MLRYVEIIFLKDVNYKYGAFIYTIYFLCVKFFFICGTELTKWSHENFGSVRNELEKKRKQLAKVEKDAMNSGLNNRVRELKNEI